MWKNIGNFLERFANLKPSQGLVKDISAEVVSGVLGIKFEPEDLEERNGILFLKSNNPAFKNEVFLKKEVILEVLKEKLGSKAPKDLRF